MAAKNRYYVVWRGLNTGIFDSWDECKKQITNFNGAQYKGFPTIEEARAAHAKEYWQVIRGSQQAKTATSESIIVPSLAVDAACSGNPGVMEYRGVLTGTGREVFHIGPFKYATNNIGEFLAIVHGLALLKQNGSTMPIYSDSMNAIAWVRNKKCKTKLERVEDNIEVFSLIARAEKWLKENTYSTKIIKWDTDRWGEIPADFGRK